MELLLTLAFLGLLFWMFRGEKLANNDIKNKNTTTLSDEEIFRRQVAFEKKLDGEHYPDSIPGKYKYIYFELMQGWFEELQASNRYDAVAMDRIQRDWLQYMEQLESAFTLQYLWLDEEEEGRKEQLATDMASSMRIVEIVQQAFAKQVGKSAENQLKNVLGISGVNFTKTGKLKEEESGN